MGNVVRRMFADIDADIYVLAEPAGGYDPADGSSLVNALITERVDMVVGIRRDKGSKDDDPLHQPAGDNAFRWLYHRLFGGGVSDIGSGFRAMSRRFVKSFPAISKGFDIEVELSMHASQLMVPVAEITLEDTPPVGAMAAAPAGLARRLRAARAAARLLRDVRPFIFYSSLALIFWALGLMLLAPRLLSGEGFSMSSALLGLVMLIAGFIFASCGLILDALRRSRIEQKRILFLTVPALGAPVAMSGRLGAEAARFVRFALVGGTGFVVDAGLLTVLHNGAGFDPFTARLVSISVSAFTTWRLNRAVTFGASDRSQASEGARYALVAALTAGLNYCLYAAGADRLA